MNKTAASIVLGNNVISIDETTLEIMLAAIDTTMGDGLLMDTFSKDQIVEANEVRSLIEFALIDAEKAQLHPNQLPLARSTTVS